LAKSLAFLKYRSGLLVRFFVYAKFY